MPDLAPMHARVDTIEQGVRAIAIPVRKEAKETDLSVVMAHLAEIERRVAAIRLPPSTPVDLAPLLPRLNDLRAGLDRPANMGAWPGRLGCGPSYCQRQVQIRSSELSSPDCARSVKRWAMR